MLSKISVVGIACIRTVCNVLTNRTCHSVACISHNCFLLRYFSRVVLKPRLHKERADATGQFWTPFESSFRIFFLNYIRIFYFPNLSAVPSLKSYATIRKVAVLNPDVVIDSFFLVDTTYGTGLWSCVFLPAALWSWGILSL
jgi:hypothetical protein